MFSHVMVGANDIGASRKFYDALLGTIGAEPSFEDSKGRIFWMTPQAMFAITKPINGEEASGANGGTIGFVMDTPERADAWHKAGTESGGVSCEDAPGWRDGEFGRMYLAYLRDPAGNKLCALHRPA